MSQTCSACFAVFPSHLSLSRHARRCALLRADSEANRKKRKDSLAAANSNGSVGIGRGAERRSALAAKVYMLSSLLFQSINRITLFILLEQKVEKPGAATRSSAEEKDKVWLKTFTTTKGSNDQQ